MNAMNSTVRPQFGARGRRAFTLIELIIVIALTAVLFGLLLVPLISAIRYTQQAQIVTAAQDAARTTRERLTRELGSALFVFDGTSHPFMSAAQPLPGDDRYTNFLNLEIPGLAASGSYKSTIAHAYACKLDFAQPRAVSDSKTPTDPTTGEPISYRSTQNGSAIISNPAYVFPLAAGTTLTRYWIGLKDPTQPYNNTREGKSIGNIDNTYVLYRAQFQPYVPKYDAGGNQIGLMANTKLFATGTKMDAKGNKLPELDDPDFFRYVKPTDVDWLDDTHTTYSATTVVSQDVTSHNTRVDLWRSIAKVVIPGPNVDLILLPHNADNTLNYDTGTGVCSASGCPGIAHSGLARDPVTGNYYPIVNTSVTFRPGTVSGDAVPGTTSDYGSQAVPTIAGESGYGYVPTVYTATSQSWSLPYHVSLYPGNYTGAQEYYDTQISSVTDTTGNPPLYTAGDLLEFKHTDQNDLTGMLVFNISKGYPLQDAGSGTYKLGGLDFVPLMVNPDTGTLNFGTPSLPNGPTDRNQRNWDYSYNVNADTDLKGGVNPSGLIDLSKPVRSPADPKDSPLTNPTLAPTDSKETGVRNAHIIPGGIRVTGPDTTAGPNNGQTVPYTPVNSVTDVGENQYFVDYSKNLIQLSVKTGATTDYLLANPSAKVSVVYDYQANMTLTDPMKTKPTPGFSADNPYLPMQVKVEYQTRDLIDVSIGVRIYDITNNRAQVIPAETKIKIGNSNRG
jgi:prepilin-type N-terminal cleavage/methylation domain-containing protein